MSRKKLVLLLVFPALIAVDFVVWSQVAVQHTRWCWQSEWNYDAGKTSTVSIVRSDNLELSNPVPITDTLGYAQVAEMVEKAVELAGGFENLIPAAARKIVLKPNLVDPAVRGDGCVTDYRVVRALVLLLYRINPEYEIAVAEGAGGWARPGTSGAPSWSLQNDGYAMSGFKNMIESLQSDASYPDLKLSWVDLNYDDVETVTAASPRLSDTQAEFYLPKTVLDADYFINVPVLKVHETGITVGLKNYVGVLPGMVYGWSKDTGFNRNGLGLDHTPNILQKNFVDVARTVGCDFTVVDAIVGKERTKYASPSGDSKRRNMILASSDIVSVDAVSALLMDINPDDVEHVCLAALTGMGQNDIEKINVVGSTIEESATKYYKAVRSMDESLKNNSYRYYGQSNRTWLLNGPYFTTDMSQAQAPELSSPDSVYAGKNGWSEAVYFYDDLIDPAGFFQDTTDCIYYAFSYLEAPEATAARLWAGSDGPMKVWINGEPAYDYSGSVRTHRLPNDVVNVDIAQGMNSVLVKVKQTAGVCRFSLNICDTETDSRYAGNRLEGTSFLASVGPGPLNGDYDNDETLGIFDVLGLLKEMRKPQKDPAYDFNSDGQVNIFDVLGLLQAIKQPGGTQ